MLDTLNSCILANVRNKLFEVKVSSPGHSRSLPPLLILMLAFLSASCAGQNSEPFRIYSGDQVATATEPASPDGLNEEVADAAWDLERRYYRRDLRQLLVPSDGSRSLGNPKLPFNDERDQGSRIIFVDAESGDNDTAEIYWWDGEQIIDSSGSAVDEAGRAYGRNPLRPNLAALKPFRVLSGDKRLKTQQGKPSPQYVDESADRLWRFAGLAGGYPDWFLFRRGQSHSDFHQFTGGRSESQPAVFGAYGPYGDGRALLMNGVGGHNWGQPVASLHVALFSLGMTSFGYTSLNQNVVDPSGEPVTAYLEDVKLHSVVYPPRKSTFVRCVIVNHYDPNGRNQGYFTNGFHNEVTFDETIFYRNGYKTDPTRSPDPKRTIFDRNIYQGGGAQLGHRYLNVISADGGSGGPQMRLGGVIRDSLIVEGYWYSSTRSNKADNPWMIASGQSGRSAIVRDNVQLVYRYPTEADPDTSAASDTRAQPAWGYALQGASFGAVISGNIISGAMLEDELGGRARYGLALKFQPDRYGGDRIYTQQNNEIRDNIIYKAAHGLILEGSAAGVSNINVRDNVFVASDASQGRISEGMTISGNRFYVKEPSSLAGANEIFPYDTSLAKSSEDWIDPDRTLRRYVVERLKLYPLEWADVEDSYGDAAAARAAYGERFDPTGLRTFMAVAANMRAGGSMTPPQGAKPDPNGDYAWDERYTAAAVVNWIRAGFGLPEASSTGAFLIDDDALLRNADIGLENGGVIPADAAQLFRLYYGALGRLPDTEGFSWWSNEIAAGNQDLHSMAAGFLASDEFQGLADADRDGTVSSAELLTHIYENVFGRSPDKAGYEWWLGELDSGRQGPAGVLVDMTQSNEYVELTLNAAAAYLPSGAMPSPAGR